VLRKNGLRSSRLVAWLAALSGVACPVVACVELKGSLDSDCLKNEDCQSGVCSQLHCAEPPPPFELEAGSDAGADGAIDGAPGTATDGPAAPPADATVPFDAPGMDVAVVPDSTAIPPDSAADAAGERSVPDASNDAPTDAPADAGADAPADAGADAPADAGADTGENG
jgi:hypothetical protein